MPRFLFEIATDIMEHWASLPPKTFGLAVELGGLMHLNDAQYIRSHGGVSVRGATGEELLTQLARELPAPTTEAQQILYEEILALVSP